ncbi:MAG: DUF1566 domain-containing protein [Chlorobium sp.]|nr:MAG: DUF1566 domain-containing protein [Chlorobium sp.]
MNFFKNHHYSAIGIKLGFICLIIVAFFQFVPGMFTSVIASQVITALTANFMPGDKVLTQSPPMDSEGECRIAVPRTSVFSLASVCEGRVSKLNNTINRNQEKNIADRNTSLADCDEEMQVKGLSENIVAPILLSSLLASEENSAPYSYRTGSLLAGFMAASGGVQSNSTQNSQASASLPSASPQKKSGVVMIMSVEDFLSSAPPATTINQRSRILKKDKMMSFTPLVVVGGKRSYVYAVSSGTLPAGLTLDPLNGTVSGIPNETQGAREVIFSAKSKDNAIVASSAVSFTVLGSSTLTNTAEVRHLIIGETIKSFMPFSQTPARPPYSFSVQSGNLPPGLKLDSTTGAVTGTPTEVYGLTTVTFLAKDSSNTTVDSCAVRFEVTGAALKIGSNYQGGIIAYLLKAGDPGFDAAVVHGLIAAPFDQSEGIVWNDGMSSSATGATISALGAGFENTSIIILHHGGGSYAAKLCQDLVLNGYSDWYLPSKDELNILYLNKDAVGGFVGSYYWSSSESSAGSAWDQYFGDGTQNASGKIYYDRVRALRSF